ncbi:MAG: GTPase Era [Acidimicrobiia bacterium]|nr:GTPase Era [Acidimicrobiia bacterium]
MSLVGRPNVGKSTLVNQLVGTKVSIVSSKPQTTRTQIRGVRTTPESQIILLDTPGIHRPRTLLGERCNERSVQTLGEVDVVCLLVEANASIGPGDRFIADLVRRTKTPKILVVNKVDIASHDEIGGQLAKAGAEFGEFDAYVPVSAKTGEGIDALIGEILSRMPEGPLYYPDGVVSDQPETTIVAELLREKLLEVAREELPHSIMVTADFLDDDEDDEPDEPADGPEGAIPEESDPILRYRAVVRVERDSQKGIVIGKGGAVIRDAGTAARHELERLFGAKVYLETTVKVDKEWQRRAHALDRLGL